MIYLELRKQCKCKQIEIQDEVDIDELWKTHGICTNYCYLQNPFSEEEDDEETFLSIEEIYIIIARDELTSLKDAKNSPEWPEWQKAMQEELDLLKEMGTWAQVQKPPNAVPISNKWSGSLIYIQPLLAVEGLARGKQEHFCSLTLEYLALIQSWSKQ